jgi:hypothetical protein
MPSPLHPNLAPRQAEPRSAAASLRLAAESSRADRDMDAEPRSLFTAGDRLAVSSELTQPSGGAFRTVLLVLLLVLAGVGAATILRMLATMI